MTGLPLADTSVQSVRTYKIVLVGSNIRSSNSPMFHLMTGKFARSFYDTIGLDTYSKEEKIGNIRAVLSIWNISSNERFRSIRALTLLGTRVAIVLYQAWNPSSLERAHRWIREIREVIKESGDILLVAETNNGPEEKETIAQGERIADLEHITGHFVVSTNNIQEYAFMMNEVAFLCVNGFYVFSRILPRKRKMEYVIRALQGISYEIEHIFPPLSDAKSILEQGNISRILKFRGIQKEFKVSSATLLHYLHSRNILRLRDKLIWQLIREDYISLILNKHNVEHDIADGAVFIKGKYNKYKISIHDAKAYLSPSNQSICIVPTGKLTAIVSDPVISDLYGVESITLTGSDAMLLSIIYTLAFDTEIRDDVLLSQILPKK